VFITAFVLLVCGLIAFTILVAAGRHEQARAKSFVDAVRALQVGRATYVDAERIARTYGGRPWDASPAASLCGPGHCYFYFEFQNPRNRVPFPLPRVNFVGLLHIEDDRLVSTELSFQTDARLRSHVQTYDVVEALAPRSSAYGWPKLVSPGFSLVGSKVDKDGTPWVIQAWLDSRASKEAESQAYSFNFQCLTFLGCGSAIEVVPPNIMRLAHY
jgi:hypothetical protein